MGLVYLMQLMVSVMASRGAIHGARLRRRQMRLSLPRRFAAAVFAGFSLLAGSAARAATPAVGSPAPEFKLQDSEGKWHSLADYRGKWVVLYFYPKDGTPGCTTQACEFRDNVFAFRNANA